MVVLDAILYVLLFIFLASLLIGLTLCCVAGTWFLIRKLSEKHHEDRRRIRRY